MSALNDNHIRNEGFAVKSWVLPSKMSSVWLCRFSNRTPDSNLRSTTSIGGSLEARKTSHCHENQRQDVGQQVSTYSSERKGRRRDIAPVPHNTTWLMCHTKHNCMANWSLRIWNTLNWNLSAFWRICVTHERAIEGGYVPITRFLLLQLFRSVSVYLALHWVKFQLKKSNLFLNSVSERL